MGPFLAGVLWWWDLLLWALFAIGPFVMGPYVWVPPWQILPESDCVPCLSMIKDISTNYCPVDVTVQALRTFTQLDMFLCLLQSEKLKRRFFLDFFLKLSRVFLAPNGTRLSARCHFTVPKKLSISRAQPPPTCYHKWIPYASIQNIMHGAVKIIGA